MIIFERAGPVNTDAVIEVAKAAAAKCDCIVAASITGDSAIRIAERIPGKKVVCVTCPQGMHWEVDHMDHGPFRSIPELREIRNRWLDEGLSQVPMSISVDNRLRLERLQVDIVQGTIPLFGPTFSMRVHLRKVTELDVVAKTLEMISTGTLVGLECAMMVVDAGVIPEGSVVLALAGTERGLDTAWTIQCCASANLYHPTKGARFIELLAKPGLSVIPDVEIEYLR